MPSRSCGTWVVRRDRRLLSREGGRRSARGRCGGVKRLDSVSGRGYYAYVSSPQRVGVEHSVER